jgi:hypothetical protein
MNTPNEFGAHPHVTSSLRCSSCLTITRSRESQTFEALGALACDFDAVRLLVFVRDLSELLQSEEP